MPKMTEIDKALYDSTTSAVASGVGTEEENLLALTQSIDDVIGAVNAPIDSPSLTGVPLAPTAVSGTDTTQIATTEFVLANSVDGDGYALLDSPDFTGVPTSTTATAGTSTTQIATTAFVMTNVGTTVIDDLTTGGTTDALSAEQGVVLQSIKVSSIPVEAGESAIPNQVVISQADYDAIATKVATTLYVIVG